MENISLNLEQPIKDSVTKIRFAPNSNNILISSWDSTIRLYDVDAFVTRFDSEFDGPVLDCCFQDECSTISACSNGFVQRSDLNTKSQAIIGKHGDSVIRVEYSDQTGQVIAAGLDRKLIFWDIKMKGIGVTETVDSEVWSLSVSGIHLLAAVGSKIVFYDLRSLRNPVQSKDFSHKYQISCISSFQRCQGYAVGSHDGCVELKYSDSDKDCEMGYAFWCNPKSKYQPVSVNDIKFHPLDSSFVTGDNEGYTVIWNAESKKRVTELDRFPNSISSLSYNKDGQLLAVACSRTYQEAEEIEEPAQIFLCKLEGVS